MSITDTTPTASAVQLDVLRRLGPEARWRLAVEMSEAARTLAQGRLQAEHPGWSAAECRREFVRRVLASAPSRE